jgi:hypothetical protein
MSFFVQILIAIVLAVVSYMLAPKPKRPKPGPVAEIENPTADAGRPIPVVFGTVTIKGPNFLWYGDKDVRSFQIKA